MILVETLKVVAFVAFTIGVLGVIGVPVLQYIAKEFFGCNENQVQQAVLDYWYCLKFFFWCIPILLFLVKLLLALQLTNLERFLEY